MDNQSRSDWDGMIVSKKKIQTTREGSRLTRIPSKLFQWQLPALSSSDCSRGHRSQLMDIASSFFVGVLLCSQAVLAEPRNSWADGRLQRLPCRVQRVSSGFVSQASVRIDKSLSLVVIISMVFEGQRSKQGSWAFTVREMSCRRSRSRRSS